MNHPRISTRSLSSRAVLLVCSLGALLLTASASTLSAQRMRIGSSNPTGIASGATFFDALFAAGDTVKGVELWYHKPGNTLRLIDVYPGPISSYPGQITRRSPTNGNTWFVARAKDRNKKELGRELHYYPSLPGSTAGSFVKDIRPGPAGSHPKQLTLVGKLLFFTADDGKNGRELWVSNGTILGTRLVKDLAAGSANPFGLTAFGGRCYFAATGPRGTELYVSNGTSAGTQLLKDIRLGTKSSTPGGFTEYRGKLYFAATTDRHGRELWCTNGTSAGTVLVADIAAGTSSSAPSQLTAGSRLAFTAFQKATKRQLYVRGTAGAPIRLSNLVQGHSISQLTAASGGFWFRANTKKHGQELWRTSGAGVSLVHDLWAGAKSSFPSNLFPFGTGVLFRANDGSTGFEYWRTDGATATLIKNIRAGQCDSRPSRLVPIRSVSGRTRYLFAAKGDKNGVEFWDTNGFSASLVEDIDPLNVLPGLHWDTSPTEISITIKDGAPSRPGLLIIGIGVMPRLLTFPWLRGAISVNLFGQTVELPFRTDPRGAARFVFPSIRPQAPTNIVSQAFVLGSIDASAAAGCNQGALALGPMGPRVEGRICLDDESGEYSFCALRTDALPGAAYLGLYQRAPGGDLELIRCYPIHAFGLIEDSGQIEILVPLEEDDPTGRHLEIHLFSAPPTPASASPASLVTTSYC